MQTMIDSTMPEIATRTVNQDETKPTSEPRERVVSWLIVGASLLLAYLVFRLVMLELDVHGLLDELLAMAGQSPLPKT